MAREKHVYPTDRIAHLWAHQTQADARNPQGNLYFKGDTIYSYRDSFPIGKHVTNSQGEKGTLVTTDTYSNTTAGHVSAVRQSVANRNNVFHVNDLRYRHDGSPEWAQQQLAVYSKDITESLLQAKRCRLETRKAWKVERAESYHDEAIRFARFYELDSSTIPALDMDLSVIEAARREVRKAELAEEKARAAKIQLEQAEAIAAWRKGLYAGYFSPYGIPTMLRIKGDQVQTSRGVEFPVKDAIDGLKLVRRVMAKGSDWPLQGAEYLPEHPRLGHYRIDKVTKTGTVHAGCHVVTWDEIERIAPELERASVGTVSYAGSTPVTSTIGQA